MIVAFAKYDTPNLGRVEVTRHAAERAAERMPGRDVIESLGRAVRLSTKAVRRELRRHRMHAKRKQAGNEYWRDPVLGTVFVVQRDAVQCVLVTVFNSPFRET